MGRIGVLALQGGFAPHLQTLLALGHSVREVRTAGDFADLDGLILPGGESTAQLRLLSRHGLDAELDAFVRSGRPVLCTCAGLILAAREVSKRFFENTVLRRVSIEIRPGRVHAPLQPRAHSCTLPHSASKVCTSSPRLKDADTMTIGVGQ